MHYVSLLEKLEKDSRVKQVFNTDLSHVQQYLFHRLKIEPTSKVDVKYDGSKLVKLVKIGDEYEISPPPFSILHITVKTFYGKVDSEDSVVVIKSRYVVCKMTRSKLRCHLIAKRKKISLKPFATMCKTRIQISFYSRGDHYASTILDYLFARMETLGFESPFGKRED